jgi:hypothetical protein
MPANLIKDPIIKLYFDLIASKTDKFKGFYYGDPLKIPTSMLPALIGMRRATTAKQFTNAEDQHDLQLVFTVVTDIRKDISDQTQLVPGWTSIFDLMEGRDPATYQLKPESLMYILRHNVDFAQAQQIWADISAPTKIQYALVMNRRGGTVEPAWSIEATISTTVTITQLR